MDPPDPQTWRIELPHTLPMVSPKLPNFWCSFDVNTKLYHLDSKKLTVASQNDGFLPYQSIGYIITCIHPLH